MSDRRQKLFRIADRQSGLFTAKQACAAGYPYPDHPIMTLRSHWTKEKRGIYRLIDYPYSDDEQYVLWALWSTGHHERAQGIYSYDTALVIHELSDVNPTRLHMTVPPRFRRSITPDVLKLYRATLKEDETIDFGAYRVTSPYRTIYDTIDLQSLSLDIIVQAAVQALQKGLLKWADMDRLQADPRLDKLLVALIQREVRNALGQNV